jgi:hypothetical protein
VKTLSIELGSPWENGYVESLNGKPRAKLLNDHGFTVILSMVAPDPAARELVGAERQEELGMGMSKDPGYIDRLYGLVDRIDIDFRT